MNKEFSPDMSLVRSSLIPRIIPSGVITTDNLSVYYRRKVALERVNLSLSKRKVTAIVGPSGCGKTSLLYCLNRLCDLVPGCWVTGSVRLGDKEIFSEEMEVRWLRRRVGMIFQKPNPFPLSIIRNIEFPLKEHGVLDRSRRRAMSEVALRKVALWDEVKDRLDGPALSLSGGQQQRLCIARALTLEPEVLLLDEPCSALDPISAGVVEDLIGELRQQFTIVIVTHNLAQARRVADFTAFFWLSEASGRLEEFGRTDSLFESPTSSLTRSYIKGMRG